MFIKPVNGKQVPDPFRGGYLPDEGAVVDEYDTYWRRRLNDGDVEEVKPKTK